MCEKQIGVAGDSTCLEAVDPLERRLPDKDQCIPALSRWVFEVDHLEDAQKRGRVQLARALEMGAIGDRVYGVLIVQYRPLAFRFVVRHDQWHIFIPCRRHGLPSAGAGSAILLGTGGQGPE